MWLNLAGSTCGHAEPRTWGSEVRRQREVALGGWGPGQRLLMLQPPQDQTGSPSELIVIQIWTEELKRLVPVN